MRPLRECGSRASLLHIVFDGSRELDLILTGGFRKGRERPLMFSSRLPLLAPIRC